MALIKYPVYEVIKVAIEIEKNGYQFYSGMAKCAKSPLVAERFLGFAEEEIKHRDFFERLARSVPHKAEAELSPVDEYLSAVANAAILRQKDDLKALACKTLSDREAVQAALEVERNAILYFTELLRFVPEKEKGVVQEIVEEEKKHLTQLSSLASALG